MAIVQAQTPSSSTSQYTYHVFLSFRGTDTRKTFTDHLYTALKHAGFDTFRDAEGIERGEIIKSELQKAIKQSGMSIIVFSKNFVSSKSCLYEVETILEHSKKSKHAILPVFYDVDPFEVKKQAKGLASAEGFWRHETQERQKEWKEKAEGWSIALKEVANMGGMVLQNEDDGHESKLIQKIVGVVKQKLTWRVLDVSPHLIGIDSRADSINLWLSERSTNVGILVIYGMGGIGKTTIAKFIYNSNYYIFDGASFLENIREVSKKPKGVIRLQSQLLSDILHNKTEIITSIDEGINKLQCALRNKRVLLILDDVDEMQQLDAVFGIKNWCFPGSKIIITTRRESLLKAHENYEVYKVEKLSDHESLELFSWHAFGQKRPEESYLEQTERFVHYCDGLPLALMVLGRPVCGQSLDVWKSALKKLEAISDREIVDQLRISYDLLDVYDRKLFLDIVCFFVGKKKKNVVSILDGPDCFPEIGIQNLIDRCLITIEDDRIRMHQLLEDMGRQIIFQESTYPEERSRIWRHIDSYNILKKKTGTKKIEGIILDMNMLKISNKDVLNTEAFENMHHLRLLKLNNFQLSGNYEVFPESVIWLYWRGFHLKSLPNNFPLENLIFLDLRYSKLEQVWNGTKVLGSLKILNLSHSPCLTKARDFSNIPNLERLVLKNCQRLVELGESIANLERLSLLNLQDCKNLRKIPMIKSLEQLIISGCSKLAGWAEQLGKMESLIVLRADRTDVNQVLSNSRDSTPSHAFILPRVPKISKNPERSWNSLPTSLVTLSLAYCNLYDDDFSQDFSKLSNLKYLFLGGNPVSRLPDCIKDLKNMKEVDLSGCPRLKQIQWPSVFVERLDVSHCTSLKTITRQSVLDSAQSIRHSFCPSLCYIQSAFKIEAVGKVDLQVINNIGFFNLDSMANFDLRNVYRYKIMWDDLKFNTYFPGREVPHWFSYKITGSTISFTLPSFPFLKVQGFNLCLVYKITEKLLKSLFRISVTLSNKSKCLDWTYGPRCPGVPEADKNMVWLSHWHWGCEIVFEDGDEVQASFDIINGEIKECGVHVLYYEEEEEIFNYYKTLSTLWDSNSMMWNRPFGSLSASDTRRTTGYFFRYGSIQWAEQHYSFSTYSNETLTLARFKKIESIND